jgi:hypothetical protein
MAEHRDRIRVQIAGKDYSVVGGGFQEMLAAVKQINGRRFVGELKVWQLPGSFEDIQTQLEISGYRLEGGRSSTAEAASAGSAQPTAPAAFGADRIRVMIQGRELAVVGGSFQEMLAAVKAVPGRRFDPENKRWEIPGEGAIIKNLIETAGFQLEGADQLPAAPAQAAAVGIEFSPPDFGPATPPPPFETPDFSGEDEAPSGDGEPPYEPPDWWDDDATPPPVEPPDGWDTDQVEAPVEPAGYSSDEPLAPGRQPTRPKTAPASAGPDQIRIRLGGIPLLITSGGFQAMLAFVKELPGRRFDGQDKVWDIPADLTLEEMRQRVEAAGFVMKRG